MRPAKTQVSLGRPVWTESSLSAWTNLGALASHWANSEGSDQTGRMPRLIWALLGAQVILLVLSWGGSCLSKCSKFISKAFDIHILSKRPINYQQASSTPLVVGAIDFGTTFSGWAYSFLDEFTRDPAKAQIRQWNSGTTITEKTPTCALISPNGKTIEGFGYDAKTSTGVLPKIISTGTITSSGNSKWHLIKR